MTTLGDRLNEALRNQENKIYTPYDANYDKKAHEFLSELPFFHRILFAAALPLVKEFHQRKRLPV